jgi:hypothetical protein
MQLYNGEMSEINKINVTFCFMKRRTAASF